MAGMVPMGVLLSFLWFGLFLGEQYDVVYVFVHPFFRVAQCLLVLADGEAGLMYTVVLPVGLGYNVVYGLFGH